MSKATEPQAVIIIEEEHVYMADLAVVPFVTWQKASGKLRVEIPYDPLVFKQDASGANVYPLGFLHLSRPGSDGVQTLPVHVTAGLHWQTSLKSNSQMVIQATYEIEEPADPLVSLEGAVLDDLLGEAIPSSSEGIFQDMDTSFSNPLALVLKLWIPDLLEEVRPSDDYKLEMMLLRGEGMQQLFLPNVTALGFEQKLAESLATLANKAGGSILLGAHGNGRVSGISDEPEMMRFLKQTALKGALQSIPPIPIGRLAEIKHQSGKKVVHIEVPRTGLDHRLKDVEYQRGANGNTAENMRPARSAVATPLAFLGNNLAEVFDRTEAGAIALSDREDMPVLNSSNGLKNLQLGAYLCGLINAGKRTGYIVITNSSTATGNRLANWVRTDEDLDSVLEKEMAKLLPRLDIPNVERNHIGDQQIMVIHLPEWDLPVALYNGKPYLWKNRSLNETAVEALFEKYLDLTSSWGRVSDSHDVFLEKALLYRPVRPPESLDTNQAAETQERLEYDVAHQAQVWRPRPLKREQDTVGYSLQLSTPLRQISLTLRAGDQAEDSAELASGQLRVRLNDVLVSDLQVRPEANQANPWFNSIPIYKRTILRIDYQAHLNELFQRRTKTSRMHFLIPDVLLDRARVEDLAQMCADVGFRVFEKTLFEVPAAAPEKATIRGIRSYKYFDIGLIIGLTCHRSELKRELHYDGWRDSKSTHTAMLDVRVKMWGSGERVEKEIGQLQMQLYQTMNQRLQHLRAE